MPRGGEDEEAFSAEADYPSYDPDFAHDKCLLLARELQQELSGQIIAARVALDAESGAGDMPHFALLLLDNRVVDIYGVRDLDDWLEMSNNIYVDHRSPIDDAVIIEQGRAEDLLAEEASAKNWSAQDFALAHKHAQALARLAGNATV